LSKPFKLADLLATLTRIQALQAWVMNDGLRTLIGRMSSLPSLPEAYFRLCTELNSPHSNLEDIGALISNDPALTAKMLQLVNSAFFGFARPVAVATEAVQLLGVNTIRAMALTTHIFSVFNMLHLEDTPAEGVWEHSMKVSQLALQHARREAASRNVMEQAFTAGALHDIGKLILAANLPAEYRKVGQRVCEQNVPLVEAECAAFGVTHADVGGYLLGVWGLPVPLVEAVALHHESPPSQRQPTDCGARPVTPLSAVRLANAQAHSLAPA
jgi:HD-like signal output (HDOD) protein